MQPIQRAVTVHVKHVQQMKGTDKIVFLGEDREQKRKFNRSLQRFKKCEEKVIHGENEETSKTNEKLKRERKVKETRKQEETKKREKVDRG